MVNAKKGAHAMIEYVCPNCGRNLQIRDEFAGRWGRCNYCKGRILAPVHRPSTLTHRTYKDADNRGIRLESAADANAHWSVVHSHQREEPCVIFGFEQRCHGHDALLALDYMVEAEDTKEVISLAALTFGYYELNDGTYEAVVCGATLTPEQWQHAVEQFARHHGRKKRIHPPTCLKSTIITAGA